MKFVVYSRATMAIAIPPSKSWAVISVCERGDFPDIIENEYLAGRLNLQFHDIDGYKNGEPAEETRTLFNEDHARQVLDFVQDQQGLGTSVIYIHCLMGQSRSAGMAAALDKALNGDDSRYFARGPYKPNMRVYRCVLDEAHQRGLIG